MPPEANPAPATGVVPPATGGQTPPAPPAAGSTPPTPPAPPAPPATGDPDAGEGALGDAGKRAIDRMKGERDAANDRAKAAEDRAKALEDANKTDTEKALDAAKAEGNAAATKRYETLIRRSEVKTALAAAGASATLIDLAARADEFAELKVSDSGDVEGLAEAVAKFKKSHPDLFGKPGTPAPGTADLGVTGGAGGAQGALTLDYIKAMKPDEYARRRGEVAEFLKNQGKT